MVNYPELGLPKLWLSVLRLKSLSTVKLLLKVIENFLKWYWLPGDPTYVSKVHHPQASVFSVAKVSVSRLDFLPQE